LGVRLGLPARLRRRAHARARGDPVRRMGGARRGDRPDCCAAGRVLSVVQADLAPSRGAACEWGKWTGLADRAGDMRPGERRAFARLSEVRRAAGPATGQSARPFVAAQALDLVELLLRDQPARDALPGL